jgi:hypothetical protein
MASLPLSGLAAAGGLAGFEPVGGGETLAMLSMLAAGVGFDRLVLVWLMSVCWTEVVPRSRAAPESRTTGSDPPEAAGALSKSPQAAMPAQAIMTSQRRENLRNRRPVDAHAFACRALVALEQGTVVNVVSGEAEELAHLAGRRGHAVIFLVILFTAG